MASSVSEEELQAKAVAPRVTEQAVESAIASEHYFTAYEGVLGERFVHQKGEVEDGKGSIPKSLGLLTICVLTLKNGYTILGQSACASFENFNEEIGRRIARGDAVNKIWPLLGYQLRDRLDQIGRIAASDQTLGEALTRLTAAQLGNPEALRSEDAALILSKFENEEDHTA